jgi:hypothetical protein
VTLFACGDEELVIVADAVMTTKRASNPKEM